MDTHDRKEVAQGAEEENDVRRKTWHRQQLGKGLAVEDIAAGSSDKVRLECGKTELRREAKEAEKRRLLGGLDTVVCGHLWSHT